MVMSDTGLVNMLVESIHCRHSSAIFTRLPFNQVKKSESFSYVNYIFIKELLSLCALHNDLLPTHKADRYCRPCKQLNHKTRQSSKFECKFFFSALFLLSISHWFK